MQAIAPVTTAQLLAVGQEPLIKVEIYVGAAWVNLNSLGGENYIEGASVSLGGAGMTPAPVAGVWSATVNNIDSIFHPQHPTSAYKAYLETERLTRISVGATYGGVDYYWQSIIGYMDEPKFSMPDYKVSISGGDYMQRLQQTELKFLENYWGSTENFVSIASDGETGAQLYAEADAMEIGGGEANNVANWVTWLSTFVSEANVGGGSTWVGKMNTTGLGNFVENLNVAALTAGKMYTVSFKYQKTAGDTLFACLLYTSPSPRDRTRSRMPSSA